MNFPSIPVLVDCILARTPDGREAMWSSKDIPQEMANYILGETCNLEHCYIEFADEFSNHLSRPRLWDWKAWRQECDRRERLRKVESAKREKYLIHKANIITLTRALEDMSFSKEAAIQSASKLLERGNIQAIRVILSEYPDLMLITSVNEIPQWMERLL